jgi:hypothetical protein
MKITVTVTLAVVALLLTGCGSGSSSSTPAQGVHSGTTSLGTTYESIILPNSILYALYGVTSGNAFAVNGLIVGRGSSNNGSYTVNATTGYYYNGATFAASPGSLSASYVAGSSLVGTYSAGGLSESFTDSVIPNFNFNTPALLSDITGNWSGMVLGGDSATALVNSNGDFTGLFTTSNCTFSGTITPDSSGYNFYDVSFTFGGNQCPLPNQTMSGIAVEYLLTDGVTSQLAIAVSSGNNATAFVGNN